MSTFASTDALMHYGVQGMRWGVRHDRPRGNGRRSTSKVKAASKKLGTARTTASPKTTRQRGIEQTQAFDSTYKIATTSNFFLDKNQQFVKPGGVSKNDSKTDAALVNPGYPSEGASNNCMVCSITYELRRRGLNVAANQTIHGVMPEDLPKYCDKTMDSNTLSTYSGANGSPANDEEAEQLTDEIWDTLLKQYGQNARGMLGVYWAMGAGHALAFETVNGKLSIVDAQSGTVYDKNKFAKTMGMSVRTDIPWRSVRLDDATFNQNITRMANVTESAKTTNEVNERKKIARQQSIQVLIEKRKNALRKANNDGYDVW